MADGFIRAACIPMDGSWHSTGGIDRARGILAKNPEVATADIYSASVLGNDSSVRQFLQSDLSQATAKGGPYGWDALTYLCFSNTSASTRIDPKDSFARPQRFCSQAQMRTPDFIPTSISLSRFSRVS